MIEHNLKQLPHVRFPYVRVAGRGWPTLPNLNCTAERQRQTRRRRRASEPSPHTIHRNAQYDCNTPAKQNLLPCRPTISATCSDDGTGTHSVMFWDFLALSSGGGAKPSGLASGLFAGRFSPRLSILSSNASWNARWSSTRPALPPPRSPNRLDGISTCEAILAVFWRGYPLVSLM